jgi:hypothetical protein
MIYPFIHYEEGIVWTQDRKISWQFRNIRPFIGWYGSSNGRGPNIRGEAAFRIGMAWFCVIYEELSQALYVIQHFSGDYTCDNI